MRHARRLLFGALLGGASLGAWACSSSPGAEGLVVGADASATEASAAGDATTDVGAADVRADRGVLDSSCDAHVAACPTSSTMDFSATIDPVKCGAPAYDQYNTGDGVEQADAVCNDFCAKANPSLDDAGGGTLLCNQTVAEQAFGVGAFHCACAP